MKLTPFITAALAASAILITSCDKPKDDKAGDAKSSSGGAAVSEKDALAGFKKAAEELNALTKEDAANPDPMGKMGKMKAVLAKVKAIKTDGLPADLKDAFTAFRGKLTEMGDLLKDMPEKKEDMLAWAQKLGTDPELGKKMGAIGGELGQLGEKFAEIAKKHGIDAQIGK